MQKVGYIHEGASTPSEQQQRLDLTDAGVSDELIYIDTGRSDERRQLRECVRALKLRGGETLVVASPGILGSSDNVRRTLRQLAGKDISLEVVSMNRTFALTSDAVTLIDLPFLAAEELQKGKSAAGGKAARGKSGRKPKLTIQQENSARRMWLLPGRTPSGYLMRPEEVAVHFDVSVETLRRKFGNRPDRRKKEDQK